MTIDGAIVPIHLASPLPKTFQLPTENIRLWKTIGDHCSFYLSFFLKLRTTILSEEQKGKICCGLLNVTLLFLTQNCPSQLFLKGKKNYVIYNII